MFLYDFFILSGSRLFDTALSPASRPWKSTHAFDLNGKAPGPDLAAVFCAGAAALRFSDTPADLGYSRTHRETQ